MKLVFDSFKTLSSFLRYGEYTCTSYHISTGTSYLDFGSEYSIYYEEEKNSMFLEDVKKDRIYKVEIAIFDITLGKLSIFYWDYYIGLDSSPSIKNKKLVLRFLPDKEYEKTQKEENS